MALNKMVNGVEVAMSAPEEAAFIAQRTADQPTLASRTAAALLRIDADVDAIYVATLSNRAEEYSLAETEAKAFISAGYTGTAPASVSSWATAKAWTTRQAADDIAATAAAWRNAQSAIRAARLARKEQARTAADAAALATVLAAWAGFVAAVRTQLGL